MLDDRNAEFMTEMKATLRQFRKDIDRKLQQLRQSNIDFVRSFRLNYVCYDYAILSRSIPLI